MKIIGLCRDCGKKLFVKKVLKEIYALSDQEKLNVFDRIIPQVTLFTNEERSALSLMSDEDKVAYLNFQLKAALALRPELIKGYQYDARCILHRYIEKE